MLLYYIDATQIYLHNRFILLEMVQDGKAYSESDALSDSTPEAKRKLVVVLVLIWSWNTSGAL